MPPATTTEWQAASECSVELGSSISGIARGKSSAVTQTLVLCFSKPARWQLIQTAHRQDKSSTHHKQCALGLQGLQKQHNHCGHASQHVLSKADCAGKDRQHVDIQTPFHGQVERTAVTACWSMLNAPGCKILHLSRKAAHFLSM